MLSAIHVPPEPFRVNWTNLAAIRPLTYTHIRNSMSVDRHLCPLLVEIVQDDFTLQNLPLLHLLRSNARPMLVVIESRLLDRNFNARFLKVKTLV